MNSQITDELQRKAATGKSIYREPIPILCFPTYIHPLDLFPDHHVSLCEVLNQEGKELPQLL